MISRTAEYALRAVVYLAEHPREASTAAEIAEGSRAPLGYLVKILVRLGRAGIVASRRGRKGGFVLGRDAAQITMHDIIAACEPPPRVLECPDDGCRALGTTCPLYQRLREAGELEMRYFRGITLRRLLHQRARCREAARVRAHEHGHEHNPESAVETAMPATYADDPAAGGESFSD